MPLYEASVIVDGWAKFRLHARNRREVKLKLNTALPRFLLVSETFEPIGEVVGAMFVVEDEEIEVHQPEEEAAYYAPVSQKAATPE